MIPAEASAKVSFRLVEGQEPDKIRKAFRDYVTARLPGDCRAEFTDHSSAPAIALDWNMKPLAAARRALTDEWGKEALLIGSGASIPIVADFKRTLGLDTRAGGVRPGRRQHPFSEREVRPQELSQGHSFVGANSRRARGSAEGMKSTRERTEVHDSTTSVKHKNAARNWAAF